MQEQDCGAEIKQADFISRVLCKEVFGMNTKALFTYDFARKAIVASASTLKKTRNPENPECKTLMRMLAQHPDFRIAEKEVKKKVGKQTYKGLTFARMADYIQMQANSKDELKKYEAVRRIAKIKGSEYALTKKWFLRAYPDYKERAVVKQEMDEVLRAAEAPAPSLQNVVNL